MTTHIDENEAKMATGRALNISGILKGTIVVSQLAHRHRRCVTGARLSGSVAMIK